MKRGTPRHKKMHALSATLNVPLYSSVGIMEMLWHYTGQHTPEGDIGSVSDAEIATAVGWNKKPDKLIGALVLARWLDRDDAYRLVVHDWPDHCEHSVRKWLSRNRKHFLPVYGQCLDTVQPCGVDTDPAPCGQGKAGQGSVCSDSSTEVSVQVGETLSGEQCSGFLRKIAWKPRDVTEQQVEQILAIPYKTLPDFTEDWTTLQGIYFRLVQFDVFWRDYWRKVGKKPAREAYLKATAEDAEGVCAAIWNAEQAQIPGMLKREDDKRPHASTWLNQCRWDDAVPQTDDSAEFALRT